MFKWLIAAVIAALLVSPASAQNDPRFTRLEVRYDGVVTNGIEDTIKIRQPDGSFSTYTGPVPDYPYQKGDAVTIGFSVNAPTEEYFVSRGIAPNADGLYRFGLGVPYYTASEVGAIGPIDVSGAIFPIENSGQPTNVSGMQMFLDPSTGSYSLDFPNGQWGAGLFDGPGLSFDPATGVLSNSNSTCERGSPISCQRSGDGGFRLTGDDKNVSTGNIRIYTPADANGQGSFIAGIFGLNFGGSWNLPILGSSGGATDVPAPPVLLLFGAGVAILTRRRKMKLRASA